MKAVDNLHMNSTDVKSRLEVLEVECVANSQVSKVDLTVQGINKCPGPKSWVGAVNYVKLR